VILVAQLRFMLYTSSVVVVVVVDDDVRTKDVTKYALPVRPICLETP